MDNKHIEMQRYLKNIGGAYFIRKLNEGPKESKQIESIISKIVSCLPMSAFKIKEESEIINHQNPLLISIGGDGTALYGMKLSATTGAPLITINLGNLGFLADIKPNEIRSTFQEMVRGVMTTEERLIIQSGDSIAANEFFIGPKESGSMFRYKIFINGILASNQSADGVIISTPTGSTGYSLSVGGAILSPESKSIQIVPVSAHTLTSRPLVVRFSDRVSVAWEKQNGAILKADGRKVQEFSNAGYADIKMYDSPSVILHPEYWNFYSVLVQKLDWKI